MKPNNFTGNCREYLNQFTTLEKRREEKRRGEERRGEERRGEERRGEERRGEEEERERDVMTAHSKVEERICCK
jgi:hypothetical protein